MLRSRVTRRQLPQQEAAVDDEAEHDDDAACASWKQEVENIMAGESSRDVAREAVCERRGLRERVARRHARRARRGALQA